MIGRMGPIPKIVHKAVFLRILVDVGDQVQEMSIRGHQHAAERVLEQAPGARIRLYASCSSRVLTQTST